MNSSWFKTLFFVISITIGYCACAEYEFFYPVSVINETEVLAIHQKNIDELQLLSWNIENNQKHPVLSSSWLPAYIHVLPNKSGFSFIHNDRLRIKYFHKRSAKSISLSEPLYDLGNINWLDNNYFYGHARLDQRHVLFESDVDGQAQILASDISCDYMYPSIVAEHLYYIKRDGNRNYSIMNAAHYADNGAICLAHFNDCTIAFLHMIDSTKGFFIEYPERVDSHMEYVTLTCHFLFEQQYGLWHVSRLFDYTIPLESIVGNSPKRLYGAPLMFLPRYNQENNCIYYASYHSQGTEICSYDIATGLIAKKLQTTEFVLGPLFNVKKLLWGRQIEHEYSFLD